MNTQYKKYYTTTVKYGWPLSEKEFNAKMSEDMNFYSKWTLSKVKPENKVKRFISKLIKLW